MTADDFRFTRPGFVSEILSVPDEFCILGPVRPPIESFAGVGHYFHLADVKAGETVVDLGSGSGMDTFIAALKVGPRGKVIGVDMTDEQRAKAERLRDRDGFLNVTYVKGYIEEAPLPDGVADVVISNGVINLATDKSKVLREAARLKAWGQVLRATGPGLVARKT